MTVAEVRGAPATSLEAPAAKAQTQLVAVAFQHRLARFRGSLRSHLNHREDRKS